MLFLTSDARIFAWIFCWNCGLEAWWTQTIVPASLFVALAPPAKEFLTRFPAWHRAGQRVHRLRDGTVESLFGTPVHAATFPRVTLWLAAVPWLYWLSGMLMVAIEGRAQGVPMRIVIPVVYVAAFVATLIVTPVLGYLAVRYLRAMPRLAKVWTLAGVLAGVTCYTNAAGAYTAFR
jgi:hypothetical protein